MVQWTMEMVVDLGGAQQDFPGTGDAGSLDSQWDLGGTSYHFPHMLVDNNWDGLVDLTFEHTHSLGQS